MEGNSSDTRTVGIRLVQPVIVRIATLTITGLSLEWDGEILWDLYSGEISHEKEIISESPGIPPGIWVDRNLGTTDL